MKPNLLVLILIWCCTINIVHAYGSVANPQTHFLNQRCSKYNASNLRSFFGSINESFSRLRDQVNNHRKHFVTAESQARGKILTHTMFQCRNYLSRIDCLACFNTASTQIRNCSSAKAARVIYDGCFLRYERGRFYNQTTEPDNGVSCGNMSSNATSFKLVAEKVLMELQTTTAKTKGFYAATKTEVAGGSAIYAIAQCVETATEDDCLQCMTVGYNNLQSCLPNTEGRAYDAGCFVRYSTTPFFADNQTIDITPYLDQVGNPQPYLLNKGCSSYNSSNLPSFFENINETFSSLKAQISNNQNKHFATANSTRGEVLTYAMFQCRNYLFKTECLACFNTASTQIRNCSAANGARIIYDGCFLRYETGRFYEETTEPGNGESCGNTSAMVVGFSLAAQQVLMQLQTVTPKIKGFYAATKATMAGGGAIYAVAQCVETAAENDCLRCMQVGYNNLQSCLPNTEGRAYDAGCFMRYSTTPFFPDNQTIDITPYLKRGGSRKKWIIVGVVVGSGGLLLIILAVFAFRRSRKPKRFPRGDILGATELKGPVNYKYADLKGATQNFSNENKLGEGGFGGVYKGTLKNGKIVAVKKLVLGKSSKMEDDFESEVKLISNAHHRNLVRLLGCCIKGEERILVYEYMANSSLDRFLFGDRGPLNWKQRYDIILGTARGLAYLHEDFHVSIIHRDIKTANILLDDDLQPKIADFGLARLLPEDRSHLSTRFAGTLGYTAPEYAMHGQLSEKADTYSYGIVVLEIVSGQKSTNVKEDEDGREYLLQRAWGLYERGMQLELVDEAIDPNEYDAEEAKKIIEIALLCTQASAATRPTMSEAVVLLKSKSFPDHLRPTMPVFVVSSLKSREDNSRSVSTTASSSNATASISLPSAR
ncbi:hypothetical protein LR48_Vigan09g144000 [Vigna angularis]|nr:hypothetical protein LR48_Vigan09g144000 [Vigna angularis]